VRPATRSNGASSIAGYKGLLAPHRFNDRRRNFRRQAVPVCNKLLKCRIGAGQVRTRRTTATAPTIEVLPERHGYRHAVNLGTKWEQYWRYQPNATTISEEQDSIVTGLNTKTLSIAATCFQYHEYGRRPGLKIRSSQEGVGSSPNFGVDDSSRIASPRIAGACSNLT
jgi:hypothetical protein